MPPLTVSPDRPRMIVDWSVLGYISWFKMRAPDYVAESPLEIEEFARNIAGHLLYLVNRFTPSELVLAVDDSKNWRAPYYDSYYSDAVNFYRVRTEPSGWIVVVDCEFFHVHQHDATEKWFVDKMKKAETAALRLDDLEQYTPFIGGKAPAWLLEEAPDCPPTVWDHPDADGLRLVVPRYKGTRGAAKWDFETPKDEFKKLVRNVARSLAPVLGGRSVRVDWAEGDDVIAAFCLAEPVIPTILVSIDSDLRQLCIPCLGLKIYDPKKAKFTTPTREAARLELLCKLLGGDTSDNIAGVPLVGKPPFSSVDWDEVGGVKNGKTTVKWVREVLQANGDDIGRVLELLDTMATPGPWARNQNLIHLGNIPEALIAQLSAAVAWREPDKTEYTLANFGLSDARILSIANQAAQDRQAAPYGEA